MRTETKIDEKKKLSEKAIQRWENEGGEVPEIAMLETIAAIEKRRRVKRGNQRADEVSG